MSDFVEQLRLAEKAAEDIYCARVDRELIDALRERMRAGKDPFPPSDQSGVDARDKGSKVVLKETH